MSAGGVAAASPTRKEVRPLGRSDRVWAVIARFSPSQGWATFLLLIATLLVTGSTVTSAHWVETPGLLSVLFWGAGAGLLLAKARAPALLLHPVGLALGFAVVVWKSSSLIEGQALLQQVQELWSRLRAWYEAFSSGGTSDELIPFTVALLAMAWGLAYASAWFIFRRNNVWVAVLLSGVAILTNLSFLPDDFALRFFIYLLLAMLLVVRMSVIQNHERWRKAGIQFSTSSGWATIQVAFWFSALVILLGALLPMQRLVSSEATRVWKVGRAPIERLEDEFARMFSGIQSQKDPGGGFFGDSLPFIGKTSKDQEIVFWAESERPSYWLSRTYSEYSPRGWIAGETTTVEVGSNTQSHPREELLKQVPVTQRIEHNDRILHFISGGSIGSTSRDTRLKALRQKEFAIDLRDPSHDSGLPEDVRQLAEELRGRLDSPPDELSLPSIYEILPSDLALISVTPGAEAGEASAPKTVTVARKGPIAPEIVSWEFTYAVLPGRSYTTVSLVSEASDDELRAASSHYSRYITDHYLQLSARLPQRVRDLAERLTQDVATSLDKALAIQAYMRGPGFVYSTDIAAPPPGSDGVDHFLFETKTGYSGYYASAMAVMLRAVGVPARLAVGYAPGEYDSEDGRWVVRDSDRHGWVQVYFPTLGWIDFEPTVKYSALRGGPSTDAESQRPSDGVDVPGLGDEGFFNLFPQPERGPGLGGPAVTDLRGNRVSLVIQIAIAAGSVAAAWLLFYFLWTLGLSNATPVERVYTKMTRLGGLAGIGRRAAYQTPTEYAGKIGDAVPSIASPALNVAWAFAAGRYGRPQPADGEGGDLERNWKRIRRGLVARAFGRLVPKSGGARDDS